jgi:hypothetical protein
MIHLMVSDGRAVPALRGTALPCLFVFKNKEFSMTTFCQSNRPANLPVHIMSDDDRKEMFENADLVRVSDEEVHITGVKLILRKGNVFGEKQVLRNLASANRWDSKTKQSWWFDLSQNVELPWGEILDLKAKIEVVGQAKQALASDDSSAMGSGSLFNADQEDGVGETQGGDTAPMSDEDKKACGVQD